MNETKSKQIDFIFNMNETEIELLQEYKYLGMVLDAHLKSNESEVCGYNTFTKGEQI